MVLLSPLLLPVAGPLGSTKVEVVAEGEQWSSKTHAGGDFFRLHLATFGLNSYLSSHKILKYEPNNVREVDEQKQFLIKL